MSLDALFAELVATIISTILNYFFGSFDIVTILTNWLTQGS